MGVPLPIHLEAGPQAGYSDLLCDTQRSQEQKVEGVRPVKGYVQMYHAVTFTIFYWSKKLYGFPRLEVVEKLMITYDGGQAK